MPSDFHAAEELCAAAEAVASALGSDTNYALVGGCACAMLGSTRATEDIDFFCWQMANSRREVEVESTAPPFRG
ncbi:hypothetical protein BDV29DRAFT_171086 [Aspergillus leporis]|uniref:Uncharacterized protein n=1 Tax=Aspergillus leporis TaxID=41062 RepID=A0A5N5X5J2_9EURO|nr:hypothetical protein BDV29DRAFT_171086 [Aspergillus leporis]